MVVETPRGSPAISGGPGKRLLVVELYDVNYASQHTKSWKETERLLRREFVPPWGKRRIPDVEKQDVTWALSSIVKRGSPERGKSRLGPSPAPLQVGARNAASPWEHLSLPTKPVKREKVLQFH